MMAVIFGFSDESGNYLPKRDASFVKQDPCYIKSMLLVKGDDYLELCSNFKMLKNEYEIVDFEIKWSDFWGLYKLRQNGKTPKEGSRLFLLKDHDHDRLLEIIPKSFEILSTLNAKIIFTYTRNNSLVSCSESDLQKMHIRSLLQRVQFESQRNNLGVLFFDPIGDKRTKLLRDCYYSICQEGDFIQNYSNVKDSLNIEYSHHSLGIQLADFLAGCFSGYLKGHKSSVDLFNVYILPLLRKYNGTVHGAGIIEVPTDSNIRSAFKKEFSVKSS